ncbi:hypothetical protein P43SY_000339 [Pythium insidiosum]|uniref:Chorein N-terminal domain-containing protein n=1 Tax=Pythium insidiosum TaxID=114742 RepID=A0AAD5Q539_PYTIN|nr:hypothetical protein P43SY_000339 [Pythium insidiosum]
MAAAIVETLQQVLSEFFVDVREDNVDFYFGDLFDPSQLRLKDLVLRSEIINALHLPFELKGGYIGDARIEGFVGFVAGSPLNIIVDNVCLVLGHKTVEWDNELALRYAKELLIALFQSVSNPSYAGKKRNSDADASPTLGVLVEFRVGLIQAALFSQPRAPKDSSSAELSTGDMNNAIWTEYIRDPSDGFLYVGFKYNLRNGPATPATMASLLGEAMELPQAQCGEEHWDVKAKVCVGTICIDYNDLMLQTVLRLRNPHASLPTSGIRLESATYFSIIQDVLSNWKVFLQRKEPESAGPLADATPLPTKRTDRRKKDPVAQRDHALQQQARVSRLLQALMQQSSNVDVEVHGMRLCLSLLTSHIERVLDVSKPQAFLLESEEIHVTLPTARAGLLNRPIKNECEVHAAGVSARFRTTIQGRAAVIEHVLRRVLGPSLVT